MTRHHGSALIASTLLACTLSAPAGSQPADAQQQRTERWQLVHAGTLLATPGKPAATRQTLVIRNDRIELVKPGYLTPAELNLPEPAAVSVIDLQGAFVMPGMMDAHVHLIRATGSFQQGVPRRGENTAPAPGQSAVNAYINARLDLAAGFTALRDVGSEEQAVFALRNAINAGYILGPTILAAGPIISVTGGHGYQPENAGDADARLHSGVCDGEEDCRRQVRYHARLGVDLIKISVTGGFSDQTGLNEQMDPAEMRAIVSLANERGMKVAAHAYAANAIRDAVLAGVSSIEHGYLLDDEGIRLMKERGTFLVPTLTIAEPPAMSRRFMGPGEPRSVTLRNKNAAFERAYKAGVKIAMGTDCGIYPHGRNADEIVKMVALGMTPADALRAATSSAAELLGIGGDTGTLEPGKRADLIALRGNPLNDIHAVQSVDFVMKSGRVAKRDGVVTPDLPYGEPQSY